MSSSAPPGQYEWAKSIPCRNIQIHGFCKWENKGCSFSHDNVTQGVGLDTDYDHDQQQAPQQAPQQQQQQPSSLLKDTAPKFGPGKIIIAHKDGTPFQLPNLKSSSKVDLNTPSSETPSKPKFNFNSATFTPSISTASLTNKMAMMSPKLSDIPTFVPSKTTESPLMHNQELHSNQSFATATYFTPSTDLFSNGTNVNTNNNNTNTNNNNNNNNGVYPMNDPLLLSKTPFYQQTALFPINYHLYSPTPPPHVQLNQKSYEKTVDDLFIPKNLRESIQRKNEESLKSILANQSGLPLNVDKYHSLYPIDNNFDYNDKSFGYISSVYKCMSNEDGKLYTMRRLHNIPIQSETVFKTISKWRSIINNSNVVRLYDAFTTTAFDDNSLIVIYDYYPLSHNLMETHFFKMMNKDPKLITEDIIWLYLIQLTNATMDIHKKGLSVKSYNPTKIIVTSENRIKLAANGIQDILDFMNADSPETKKISKKELEIEQYNDIRKLGDFILNFAKTSIFINSSEMTNTEIIAKLNYSNEFKEVLSYLVVDEENLSDTTKKSLLELQKMLAPMMMKMVNDLQSSNEYIESQMSREVENSRLVRLMAKLDFIYDRKDLVNNKKPWSETSERYPIKLFRDYLFNQTDENQKPMVDLSHVINNLNKLDAGVEENLLLVGEDEMSCLIISFQDLKKLVEKSFNQLRA